mgnify:CR=1 FL=1
METHQFTSHSRAVQFLRMKGFTSWPSSPNYWLKKKESGNLYPQISMGGAFNRRDEELMALLPDSVDGNPVPDPATNFASPAKPVSGHIAARTAAGRSRRR